MKSIHLVVHCWNPPSVTEYAQTLKWQIASLFNANKIKTTISICCSVEDHLAMSTAMLIRNDSDVLQMRLCTLHKKYLFSRAIGRNLVAKETPADVVWFCDCDYVFGEGCLESILEQVVDDNVIYYPRTHMITESHELGAQLLKDNTDVLLPEIDPAHYVPKRVTKAIGGLQIVTGNTARKYGYLAGTKWMKPVEESGGFRNTKCDIAYRKSIPLSRAIEVPNLYRLRHQVEGLFLNAAGEPR